MHYLIIGVPPVAIGVKGKDVLFTYVKPCHGTSVMKIESPEQHQIWDHLLTRMQDKEHHLTAPHHSQKLNNASIYCYIEIFSIYAKS
jgi:hypothetical protein